MFRLRQPPETGDAAQKGTDQAATGPHRSSPCVEMILRWWGVMVRGWLFFFQAASLWVESLTLDCIFVITICVFVTHFCPPWKALE